MNGQSMHSVLSRLRAASIDRQRGRSADGIVISSADLRQLLEDYDRVDALWRAAYHEATIQACSPTVPGPAQAERRAQRHTETVSVSTSPQDAKLLYDFSHDATTPSSVAFLRRTNEEVDIWMRGFYTEGPDTPFRLHCLWAWQECSRLHLDALRDLRAAVHLCLDAEYARRRKLLPGAPATTYTQTRINKLEALLGLPPGGSVKPEVSYEH